MMGLQLRWTRGLIFDPAAPMLPVAAVSVPEAGEAWVEVLNDGDVSRIAEALKHEGFRRVVWAQGGRTKEICW